MARRFLLRTILLFSLLAAWWPSLGHADAEFGDDRYSIVIGNNLGNAEDVQLSYAEADAKRFASVLQRYGGVAPENQVLMLGNTASDIRRALLKINARIRRDSSAGKASVLIVYYSGHADAVGLHPGKESLAYAELRGFLEGSPAQIRLLLLDGCRSGNVTKVKGGSQAEEFEITAQSESGAEGVIMISSSAAGEDSHESEALKSSFFSHHLTNGLVGAADENRDDIVSLSEVYAYAYRNTLRESGKSRALQHPTFSYDLKGRADPAITRLKASGRQRATRLQLREPGTYVVYRGSKNGSIVAEVNVRHKQALLSLPAGSYFVQYRRPSYYLEYNLRLSDGETRALSKSSGRKVAYARLVRKGSSERVFSQQVYSRIGAHGELLEGFGATPTLQLGYQVDWASLSLSIRGRAGRSSLNSLSTNLSVVTRELGIGLMAQKLWDLPYASFGIGLSGDITNLDQSFGGTATAPSRRATAFSMGIGFTTEIPLSERLILSAEAGPNTFVLSKANMDGNIEIGGSSPDTIVTWLAHLGIGVAF